jgi:hypothetical protein
VSANFRVGIPKPIAYEGHNKREIKTDDIYSYSEAIIHTAGNYLQDKNANKATENVASTTFVESKDRN